MRAYLDLMKHVLEHGARKLGVLVSALHGSQLACWNPLPWPGNGSEA